jgi:uncharacterized damage-inducible protein DinB
MELQQEARATRRLLERVPGDKLGWKPHAKSMSLGQLALHIAQTPGNVANLVKADMTTPPQFKQAEAGSVADVLSALDASLAGAAAALQGWDDAKMGETWTMSANGTPILSMPRMAVLRTIMLNHWYHHRGQLGVYLRLLDVPLPSVYGPTADENPFM